VRRGMDGYLKQSRSSTQELDELLEEQVNAPPRDVEHDWKLPNSASGSVGLLDGSSFCKRHFVLVTEGNCPKPPSYSKLLRKF